MFNAKNKDNKNKEKANIPATDRDADIGLPGKDVSTNSAGGDNERQEHYGSGNSSAWDTAYNGGVVVQPGKTKNSASEKMSGK